MNVSPVHGASHYELQIALDHSFTTCLEKRFIKKANSRAWFSELDDGATYYYRARAWKGETSGPWSRVGMKSLQFYGIKEPASEVQVRADNKTITVSWSPAISRTLHRLTYRVVASTDRAGKNPVLEKTTQECEVTFSGLSTKQRYFFRVYASNRGERERGDAVPKAQRPEAQLISLRSAKKVRISAPSPSGFTATWPVRSVTGHWLEVSDNEKFKFAVGYRGYPNSDTLTISDLEPETTYWCRAINADGTDGQPFAVTTTPRRARLRIGTYNVRYIQLDKATSEHSWGKRRKAVADVIAPHFDIIGVQEAATWAGGRTFYNRSQIDDLLYLLNQRKKNSFARITPDDEKNPGVHVLYSPALLRPTGRASHVRWSVDERPRGQAMIAVLETVATGAEACFVSVHLSPFISDVERLEHAQDLADRIEKVNVYDAPVVIVGDLNSHEGRVEDTPATFLTGPDCSLNMVDSENFDSSRAKSMIHSSNTKWENKVNDFAGYKIDYVLTDERIGVSSWNYVETWTPTGRIRKPIASDHHAIVVQANF